VCFDFVPQHHNIIRYRRGIAVIKDDFHTVCSWVQFKNKEAWKYDLFLGKTSFMRVYGFYGQCGASLLPNHKVTSQSSISRELQLLECPFNTYMA
jgi:hypothetical protein